MSSLYQHPAQTRAQVIETAAEYAYGQSRDSADFGAMSPPSGRSTSQNRRHVRANSGRSRNAPQQLTPHTESASASGSSATAIEEHNHSHDDGHSHAKNASDAEQGKPHSHSHDDEDHGHDHGSSGHGDGGHGHSHGGHGHSHGSMNMQGVFLHVLGDA